MTATTELTVLHADACGFSAAMAKSVDAAIAKLTAGHKLMRKAAHMFDGRVVDTTGDSLLMTFGSAQAAFGLAQHVSEAIKNQKKQGAVVTPFEFRIGITKGKVTTAGRRLFGTCINLAARIESLVARGNVGIERSAWTDVRHMASGSKVRPRLIFAKPEEPAVDFFEVAADKEGVTSAFADNTRNAPTIDVVLVFGDRHEGNKNAVIDALGWSCTAHFAANDWLSSIRPDAGASPGDRVMQSDYCIHLRTVDLPLGFRLLASVNTPYLQPPIQYFSGDFVSLDDFSTRIASLSSLLGSVIAHAEEERVRDVRRIGPHQLVAAGRASLSGFSETDFQTGLQYMQRALEFDREYPLLLSSLGRAHAVAWRFGWKGKGRDHLELASDYATLAARLAPNDARVQADLGFVRFWSNDPVEAQWHYDRSLDALPFHPELAADAGMVFSFNRNNDKAAAVLERSIANLPNDADYRLWSLGDVHFARRDYQSALKWLSRMSNQSQAQRLLAASKARLGLDASRHVQNVLLQQPGFSVKRWVAIQPFTDEAERIDYEEALLAAGLPA